MARVEYIADAVLNAIAIPFSCAQTIGGAMAIVFTWGYSPRTIQICTDGLQGCSERVNRMFKGVLGGLVSTSMAYNARDLDVIPIGISALGLAAVITTVIKYGPRPNLVFFDLLSGKWTFGWDLRR